ncbi:MAG: 3-keto-5-aminohexanoate cleavage protein [Melioribacteraceae bacterium]|nr:3-keto-5-aminohexanoate cleavage protein [Melioribacteraceae bacterium]
MLLQVALNGARSKSENQNIPHSLEEIENEVRALHKIGCDVFHIHCYDVNGAESLKPDDVFNLVSLVKTISDKIQIGISSGEWIEPNLNKRKSFIRNWKLKPDFVSVNMIEDDAIEISNLLVEKGILIEAGLNEKRAAEKFVHSNLVQNCCRVLIEPEPEEYNSAITVVNEIEEVLNSNNIFLPRLLHGFNTVVWDIIEEAKHKGYDTRIGMEDTLYLQNGETAGSNLQIINKAKQILGL